MHAHARALVALTAATGVLAAVPAAPAAMRVLSPAADVNLRDLQGAPDATPLLRVAGRREPGDPTTIRVYLKPMISGSAAGLSGAYVVATLTVNDADRTFATTVTRGMLRTAGMCGDATCSTTTPTDAWLPDPARVVVSDAAGFGVTAARGGVGMPYFQESGDVLTTSARVGRAAGGFVEVTTDLAGGGANFAADFRPLPDGGAGAWLGAWYSEDILEGAEPLGQPAGPGRGFAQRHVMLRDGRVSLRQAFALARARGAGADAGLGLARTLGVSADGATYRVTDTFRNRTARTRRIAITYRLRAYTPTDAIWTLPWLGRRDQRSNGRTALRAPRTRGYLLARPESAGPYDAAHGWAAWGQAPSAMRFETAAFADGTLRVTFRVSLPPRASRTLHLAAGVVGDPVTGRARARAALASFPR